MMVQCRVQTGIPGVPFVLRRILYQRVHVESHGPLIGR
jgi:hypothetical protein